MDYIDLIKLNKECQQCRRLKHHTGECTGKSDRKNCLIFINVKDTATKLPIWRNENA